MFPDPESKPSHHRPLKAIEESLTIFITLLLFLVSIHPSIARDTITPTQSLVDGQTLISSGGAFELGFFNPGGGSSRRYLGVWIKNISVQTVVWVANRETPLSGAGGVLNLTAGGDLALHDRAGDLLWSTGASSNVSDPIVQLLDSGNLVLIAGSNSSSVWWQSFDHPSNILLPGMKIGWDLRTNRDLFMTSWKTDSDPSPGVYSYGVGAYEIPEMYLWNGSSRMCRMGWWDGHTFSGLPNIAIDSTFSFVSNQDEIYLTSEVFNDSVLSAVVLTQSGVLRRMVWLDNRWNVYLGYPSDQCDIYAECGSYGLCKLAGSSVTTCECLRGFTARLPADWGLRDWSGGCVRRTTMNCRMGDGFVKLSGLKLPETSNTSWVNSMGFDECRDWCLRNCSCMAFAIIGGGGSRCVTWFGNLMDIREITGGGEDLYLRLAASELDSDSVGNLTTNNSSKKKSLIIIIITTTLGILFLVTVVLFLWKKKRKQGTNIVNHNAEATRGKDLELPLFDLVRITSATGNFSPENKLGEGGFGPVYKGVLFDGPVAVKRLSRSSGQGLKEFRSEIQLVAKLQHTNLVRLLGCCIEAEEKILIYEYMPNGSLDKYLFDPTRGSLLDWNKRVHIIEGITQGLLYLHKYSRLRIIHRDLKASNILLDAELNPKISDFGMARIFSLDNSEVNTNRIVGTYGYMSPEYAMEGLFSVKSDVFSFGVLLLEILSGKKCTGTHNLGLSLNLLGYTWELWTQGNEVELMDPTLRDTCSPTSELSRYINVALLCVQESAEDRPTISHVASMLSSETAALPTPKQPAFLFGRRSMMEDEQVEVSVPCSANVSLSVIQGR